MQTRNFAFALLCLPTFALGAIAEPVADFYKGKQVKIVVGYGAGGGYDVYARMLSRHFGRHISGTPTIIVQNMPGAASLVSANYLYNKAPRDGTVIATFDRGLPMMAILGGNPNVQFDPMKLTWLGSAANNDDEAFLLFARKDAKPKSVEDIRKPGGPELLIGVSATGATDSEAAKVLRDILKLNVKVVPAYRGGAQIFLAVERGEVDARLAGLSAIRSTKPDWLRPDAGMHVLLQFARTTRHPSYPDVPTAQELAPDEKARAVVELAEMPHQIPRPFAAPPDVPKDRAEALKSAFMSVAKDAAYLADAGKLKVHVSPMTGDDILKLVRRLSEVPAELRERMREIQNSK
ncbi:MAG: hypothetical protein RLZ98_2018 [Pseudomonadota bacterium]|jgi:tripartite-type tricarboxylate transporter receptor subunit TctC